MTAALIYSEEWTYYDYGEGHPLRMERLGLTWRLMEAYGLTRLPEVKVVAPERANEDLIRKVHTPEYIEVLKSASSGWPVSDGYRWGLGPGDNPVFPGMWEAACLAVGGSVLAARLVEGGEADRAFHFAGGLHHALPDRASGFCYLNDVVAAIHDLVERGHRVSYIDIDAHHGDGVQAAFYSSNRVLTISTHERGDRLFPGTGFVSELGEGAGVGYSVNLPLQPWTDDEVFLWAFEEIVPPLVRAFQPDFVVAQLGIDSHLTDPLTHLSLTVNGFAQAVRRILEVAPRLIALGGGGYNLGNVARGWTAAWAIMNGLELPAELPESVSADARRYRFQALWDSPHRERDEVHRWAMEYARRQVAEVKRTIFPLHGL